MTGDDTTRAFCNGCCRETNHSCRPIYARDYAEGGGKNPRPLRESWHLLVCLGCESVRLRRTISSPEYTVPSITEYPPAETIRTPAWRGDLPEEVQNMHREVYEALHAGAPCCATMGTRALIDMALTEVVGDIGNFQAKLAAAVRDGHITLQHKTILEAAIDAGSAATHRGFTPNEQQIRGVLGIVEHLLQGFYVLRSLSSRLQGQIPPRTCESMRGTYGT